MVLTDNEVQIGTQGRVVIPAALRKALNLKPGDRLVAWQVGESLVLERREAIRKRLKDCFRHIPDDVSLVDELLADLACLALAQEQRAVVLMADQAWTKLDLGLDIRVIC